MNLEQAYINGFVKRAAQYGYNHIEAINILKAADAELKGKQYKLDVDKDGKIEASDLKKLRQRKQAADAMTAPGTPDTAVINKVKGLFSPSDKPATPTPPPAAVGPELTGSDKVLKFLGLPPTGVPASPENAYTGVLSGGSAGAVPTASTRTTPIKRTLPPSGSK